MPGPDDFDPTLSDVFTEPGPVLGALLFTGSYPAMPWPAHICDGLAISRLDLRSQGVQSRLVITGVLLVVVTWFSSMLLLGPPGAGAHHGSQPPAARRPPPPSRGPALTAPPQGAGRKGGH